MNAPKFSIFSIILLLFFVIGSPVSAVEYYEPSQNDTIIVIGDASYYPYEYIDKDGEPAGLNVDLTKAVLNKLGLAYDIRLVPWDQAFRKISDGSADMLSGVMITKERAESLLFTVPHNYIYLSIVSRKSNPYRTLVSISGKNVGVQKDEISHSLVNSLGTVKNIALYTNVEEAMRDLSDGELDAIIAPTANVTHIKDANRYSNLEISLIDSFRYPYAFGVNTDNPNLLSSLNLGLMQIKLDGEYSDIYDKWAKVYDDKSFSKTTISILMVLVIFIIFGIAFIITLRVRIRKAVNKLNHSEHNFMEIFNATNEGIVLESIDGEILDCNQGTLDMFQYKKPEFMILDKSEILAPSEELRRRQLEYLSGHDFYTYERLAKKKDGTVFWVEITLKMAKIEGRDTVISVIRDISKRKKTQKALDETQQELILALQIGKLSAWTYDVRHDRFFYLYGTASNNVSYSIEEIFSRVYPTDVPKFRTLFADVTSGKKSSSEYILRILSSQTNTIRSLDTKILAVKNDDGEVARVVGTHRDVTEDLKVKKELLDYKVRMDFMMKSTGMLLWIYDVGNRTILSSDSSALSPSIPVSIEEYYPLVHADDKDKYMQFIDKMNDHEDKLITLEYRFKLSTVKDYKWEVVEVMPFERDEQGVPTVYLGLVRNNTKWRMMANNLIQLRKKAEESNVLKSAFLANMSHEIRTPLNAIVGFSQLITSAQSDDEREEFSEKINSNTQYLLSLVNDILDISKLESGSMKLYHSDFSVNDVCDAVFSSFSWRSDKDVELRLSLLKEDIIVNSDKTRLSQIITNFAGNAIKFTKSGYVEIGALAFPDRYEIYVEDTGIGIAEQKQKTVFERFVQINDFAQGSGLGLAISKQLAELMGGTVGVTSQIGKGSRFFVTFPIAKS